MIRFDNKLNKEIRRIVNNYNAKIYRLEKNKRNVDIEIPVKFNKEALKSLKASSRTRQELRRRLKELEDFSRRGGEEKINVNGLKIARYKYQSIKRYKRLATRRINAKIKFYNENKPTYKGQKDKFTMRDQFDLEYQNLLTLKDKLLGVNINDLNEEDINNYLFKLRSNTRDEDYEKWQNSYIDLLIKTGRAFRVDESLLFSVEKELKKISPSNFNRLIKTESLLKQIIYYYQSIKDLGMGVAFESLSKDVNGIFNELYENIGEIVKDYV